MGGERGGSGGRGERGGLGGGERGVWGGGERWGYVLEGGVEK